MTRVLRIQRVNGRAVIAAVGMARMGGPSGAWQQPRACLSSSCDRSHVSINENLQMCERCTNFLQDDENMQAATLAYECIWMTASYLRWGCLKQHSS